MHGGRESARGASTNHSRNSLIRHCEACAAVKSRRATTFSAWRGNPVTFGTPKAKSLDCRGRQGSLAMTSLWGSSAYIVGLKKSALRPDGQNRAICPVAKLTPMGDATHRQKPYRKQQAMNVDERSTEVSSSLSGFPRECAGSPFGDRFLVILGLILMDFDLLSSLRCQQAVRRAARLDGACAATSASQWFAIARSPAACSRITWRSSTICAGGSMTQALAQFDGQRLVLGCCRSARLHGLIWSGVDPTRAISKAFSSPISARIKRTSSCRSVSMWSRASSTTPTSVSCSVSV